MSRACSTCATAITARSKTGLCRACNIRRQSADPVWKAKRIERQRQATQTPEYRAACSVRSNARFSDPAARHAVSVGAKRAAQERPELVAKKALNLIAWRQANPEALREIAAANRATVTANQRGWCPPERWTEYVRLRDKMGAVEAKQIMLADIAAKERIRLAALPAFDRQMERLKAGARLVDVVPLRRPDHAFTLGGVATGALS